MPSVPADLRIDARWIVPMTTRGRVLENHTLVVRDGRILDLLPSGDAAQRYSAATVIQRSAHLLMPGLINTHTDASMSLLRGADSAAPRLEAHFTGPEFVRDGVLAAVAEMLISGITCFADRCYFPDEAARAASDQGMRAVLGLPVAETVSPWARTSAEYLTEGLRVRDEFSGHPLISTVFAPHAAHELSDATFARLAMLADELDAGIMIDLHASTDEIARSVEVYGARPIERLWQLGLLTPALTAVHMTHSSAADIDLAQRTGMAVSLGLQACLARGPILAPLSAFAASGIRLALGTGGDGRGNQDLWAEMKMSALTMSSLHRAGEPGHSAWDALAMATCGGAAVLGLDGDVGTLDAGKWADLCCVDLGGPATQPLTHPVTQLVFGGGRDIVSDVWVGGRQLLSDGEFMRLDWNRVAAHVDAWAARMNTEGAARG
jgi:5-methylthioadenosine/S-adenosylhomocysteine deaminase